MMIVGARQRKICRWFSNRDGIDDVGEVLLISSVLDRTLIPGFAFRHREEGDGWDKLLPGNIAHLLTTMDTPAWVYRWIYRAPGINSLARATSGYCGIAPVRHGIFEPIKDSSAEQRSRWLQQVCTEGLRLREGALPSRQQACRKILSWIAALRLQFYPMTWPAYLLGALAATGQGIASDRFWLGLPGRFTLEPPPCLLTSISMSRAIGSIAITGPSRAARLGRARKLIHKARRIDGLLLVALNFIPWFEPIPLVRLG